MCVGVKVGKRKKVFSPLLNTFVLIAVFLLILAPMYVYSGKFSGDVEEVTTETGLNETGDKGLEEISTETGEMNQTAEESEVVEEETEEQEETTEAEEKPAAEGTGEQPTEEAEEETPLAEIPTIKVKEGELVKISLVSKDPDGDILNYAFSEPLNELGEWQTQIGDAGSYTAKITASDGKAETAKEILIIVEPAE